MKCILPIYGVTAQANRNLYKLYEFADNLQIDAVINCLSQSGRSFPFPNRGNELKFWEEFRSKLWPNYQKSIKKLILLNNVIGHVDDTTYENQFFYILENMIRYFLKRKVIRNEDLASIKSKVNAFGESLRRNTDIKDKMITFGLKFEGYVAQINDQVNQNCDINLVTMTNDFIKEWMAFGRIAVKFFDCFAEEYVTKIEVSKEIDKHFYIRI